MNSRELKAAAMRDVYLGFTASADLTWDELPQHHRDRWLAALDAAQPEVPQGVPSVEELAKLICQTECSTNKILRKQEVEDLDLIVAAAIRDRVLAGVQAAPPPLSDEQIERMAREASYSIGGWGYDNWDKGIMRDAWRDSVRRALAAGGLEPCADPADVAISTPIIADLHKQLEAARREVDEVRRHISVTMSREHQARKDAQEAKRESHDLRTQLARESEWVRQYKQDRDDALAELDVVKAERDAARARAEKLSAEIGQQQHRIDCYKSELAALRDEVDDDNTNAAAVNDLLIQLQNVTAERDDARVELAASEIELADLRFYQREFAAVSAERDGLKKRNDVQAEQLIRIDSEISPLMSEVAELKAERDAARAELAAMKAQLDETERQLQAEKKERFAAEDELAALKSQPGWELDVTVEELAPIYWAGRSTQFGIRDFKDLYEDDRVLVLSGLSTVLDLCRSRIRPATPSTYTDADVDVEALARVLLSAWTKSRGLKSRWEDYDDLYQDGYLAEARAAIAHLRKRPEGLPTAEELKQVYRDGWNEGAGGDTCASGITAILAALAPWLREPVGWELDVTWQDLYNTYQTKLCGLQGSWEAVLDLCRSRIRPAAPRAYTDADVEKLARVMRETHAKTCGKVPDAYELDGFRNDARAAMDWMGATVGECKECAARREQMLTAPDVQCAMCAEWEKDCRALSAASRSIDARIAARAALEGE